MRISTSADIIRSSILDQIKGDRRNSANPKICQISSPGIGKSSNVGQVTDDLGGWMYTLLLAQMDAAEVCGPIAMVNDQAERVKPYWLRHLEEMAAKYPFVVLNLDELFQAPTANQNVAAHIINDHMCGPFRLPENCAVIAAGNRMKDRAGTSMVPTHLRDRLCFLEIDADLDDTCAYFAKMGVSEKVIAFLRFRPEFLSKFDKDAMSFPSPRSWDRVSTILSWGLDALALGEAITGQVGRAACADFLGFLAIFEKCPDPELVISNPDGAPIPEEPGIMYALTASLASRATDANFGAILKYMARVPAKEFEALLVKDALSRNPDLRSNAALRQWAADGNGNLLTKAS